MSKCEIGHHSVALLRLILYDALFFQLHFILSVSILFVFASTPYVYLPVTFLQTCCSVGLTKLKANHKFNGAKVMISLFDRVQNIVRKGEIVIWGSFTLGFSANAFNLSSINAFQNKPLFLHVCCTSLLKTLWEKEKLLVTSFLCFEELSSIFIKYEIVVCNSFNLVES